MHFPDRKLAPSPGCAIPIIDLTDPNLGDALRHACLDSGFFYLSQHGISAELTKRVFQASREFFALPLDDKKQVDKALSAANRGYECLRGQTLEPGSPPDLKEGFYIGQDCTEAGNAASFSHGPNQWPAGLPGFRDTMNEYYAVMLELGERLMIGLARSLGLADDYFEDFCREPLATLRLLHYPQQPAQALPGEKGCGAHTDFGGLTILLLDPNPGLQVWHPRCDGWLDVDPIPDTFVVNLGDMVARWTNDRYRSTLHRVINTSGNERYAVPFFYSGRPDHEVHCLSCCLEPGETPKYPPTTVGDHLQEMYRRTYD